MRFLLDESAEGRIGIFLISLGYDATRVGKDYPASLPDDEVLAIAVSEKRILITNDSDFGELIFKNKLSHCGVIYLRFPLEHPTNLKIASMKSLLTTHPDDFDKYLTVSPGVVRVKRSP